MYDPERRTGLQGLPGNIQGPSAPARDSRPMPRSTTSCPRMINRAHSACTESSHPARNLCTESVRSYSYYYASARTLISVAVHVQVSTQNSTCHSLSRTALACGRQCPQFEPVYYCTGQVQTTNARVAHGPRGLPPPCAPPRRLAAPTWPAARLRAVLCLQLGLSGLARRPRGRSGSRPALQEAQFALGICGGAHGGGAALCSSLAGCWPQWPPSRPRGQ